jgi:Zn-finger nucleic acid-binding protein
MSYREAPRTVECPRCGENLTRVSAGVEACARCEGIWLPSLAVETAFGTAMWPPGPGAWWRRELTCPVCQLEGQGNVMTPIMHDNFVVDRCHLHGVWLDAGELGRLLSAPRAVELEAFFERLRPEGDVPPQLAEFRQRRGAERAKRIEELELRRKAREAERARIVAEQEAARAAERARLAALAEQERRVELTKQRKTLQADLDAATTRLEAQQKQAADERGMLERRERDVAAAREELSERTQSARAQADVVAKAEEAVAASRADVIELTRRIGDIDEQLG